MAQTLLDTQKEYLKIYKDNVLGVEEIIVSDLSKRRFIKSFVFFENFIKLVKDVKLDVMIGGSTTLLATRNAFFLPGDLDCYVRNINIQKIEIFNEIVKKLCFIYDAKITTILTRMTLSWIFKIGKKNLQFN